MKYAVLLGFFATPVFFAMPVFAQDKPLCVDASRSTSYNARPISLHDVLARNASGADRRSVRVATTCIHVDPTARVALRSLTGCLALGDDVAVTTIDGKREACRVTRLSL